MIQSVQPWQTWCAYWFVSFHPEKHPQEAALCSCLHLQEWWWAHMSPCASSYIWWDVGMALNQGLGQMECNWLWEKHKAPCWRNTEGFWEEKISKASTAVFRPLTSPFKEGGLNLLCESWWVESGWIINPIPSHLPLQLLAILNGPWFYMHAVPFAETLSLDNLDSAFE